MARPLSAPSQPRGGVNGSAARPAAGLIHPAPHEEPATGASPDDLQELERLRDENAQLRSLCLELEQALHEATQNASHHGEERAKEYEALLDEKTEIIRQLHEQVQQLHAAAAEREAQAPPRPAKDGPVPREDELLALSEELERERRQLKDDEETLMQQMRDMEVSMARERAEMARQRNDLTRLQNEIRHELERLEKCGALQSKIDSLKNKLQDAATRRGSAPGIHPSHAHVPIAQAPAPSPGKKEGLFGRLFGK